MWKWNKEEREKSMNWRELKVMEKTMKEIKNEVKEEEVRWVMDSVVVAAYMRKDIGREKNLAKMSWKIRDIEVERKIEIEIKVVKGEMIQRVDRLSRVIDNKDYQVRWKMFNKMVRRWGMPRIDLFATRFSRKVQRFILREFDKKAVDQDALMISWRKRGLLYAFPPMALISTVLEKIQREEAEVILVVPTKRGAKWMTKLKEMTIDEMILGRAIAKEGREKIEKMYFKAVRVSGLKWKEY